MRYGGEVDKLGATQNIGPLHWAAHKEHVEIAMFLIENGADVLKEDGEGRNPLSMASPELADKMIGEKKAHKRISHFFRQRDKTIPQMIPVELSTRAVLAHVCVCVHQADPFGLLSKNYLFLIIWLLGGHLNVVMGLVDIV